MYSEAVEDIFAVDARNQTMGRMRYMLLLMTMTMMMMALLLLLLVMMTVEILMRVNCGQDMLVIIKGQKWSGQIVNGD